jgi:haloalkane dehalogenase
VKRFRGEHRVVVPDHLGCGLSDKPQAWPYRLRDHIDNLERLLLELDLERVTLCVHDWGGAIGMGVAARQPQRIARLVILNTAAFRSRAIPIRIAVCRLALLGPLLVRGLNGFARAATVMATEKRLSPEVKAGYLAPYGSWSDRVAIQRFVEDIPMDASHPSWSTLVEVEQALERFVDRPALLAWGERDWCFTSAFRCEWQRRLPRAEVLELEEAGHYVLEDATGAVLDRVARFLDDARSR